MKRKFYNTNDPAPKVLPPFLVVSDRGAWEATSQGDAFELSSMLRGSGISTRIMKATV